MKFTESDIQSRFEKALEEAKKLLSGLEVANGREPNIRGLTGWVYEQTIRSCLEEELAILGMTPEIREQERLGKRGRITLDLIVGQCVVEIKSSGFFGVKDFEKYRKYREKIEAEGKVYFYLTGGETHQKFVAIAVEIFGIDYAFFLEDTERSRNTGHWERFVETVVKQLTSCPIPFRAGFSKNASPKKPKTPKAKREKAEAGRDKWGAKMGTWQEKTNAVFTAVPKDMRTILRESGEEQPCYNYLKKLVVAGHIVKTEAGYRLSPKKG